MCSFVNNSDLKTLRDTELSALFNKVTREASQSKPGSIEQQRSMASLENIKREIGRRHARRFYTPGR